jgi:tRNA 2-thiouridine synthesizing protein B
MGNLYLIDKPFGENALRLAQADAAAEIVLIQDGVYLDPRPLLDAGKSVYAIKLDVEKRGLQQRMAQGVQLIDYGQLVDLIAAHKVINFA